MRRGSKGAETGERESTGRQRGIRLSPADQVRTALVGPRSRPLRTALSALGVAVGIAALTAITGIAASNQAQLLAELDDLGANLVAVQPGMGPGDELVPLPETAPGMLARVDGVEEVGVLRSVPDGIGVYRNDLIPAGRPTDCPPTRPTPTSCRRSKASSRRVSGSTRLPGGCPSPCSVPQRPPGSASPRRECACGSAASGTS